MSKQLPKVEARPDLCDGAVDVTFPDGTKFEVTCDEGGLIEIEEAEWGSVLRAAVILAAQSTRSHADGTDSRCSQCGGHGLVAVMGEPEDCPRCGGDGAEPASPSSSYPGA